jgi:flavin reductase (DIM6/NTAB) family NADH-FMN oxidoreductase RutF
MTVDPRTTEDKRALHDLLLGAVSPRPIALASTIDGDGHVNLSPFSFFNIFGTHPAILVFSPSRRVKGNTTKHTLENILETKEVVINTVSYSMVEQVSLASSDFERGVNEFVKSGLTEVPSSIVRPPRVNESPVSFECRVLEVKSMGAEGGAGNLVICEVLLIHAREYIFNEQGKVDPHLMDNVARMGGDYYCRVKGDAVFELPKPVIPVGMGIDQLPAAIRNSTVLTGNNLARLANLHQLPAPAEVEAFASEFSHLLNTSASGQVRTDILHRRAQEYLAQGEIKRAWLLLLNADHKH